MRGTSFFNCIVRWAVLVSLGGGAGCSGKPQLATIVSGGSGPPTLVLLHGYGGHEIPAAVIIALNQFILGLQP